MRRIVRWGVICSALLLLSCQGRTSKDSLKSSAHKGPGLVAVINLSGGAPESPVSDAFFPQPVGDSFLGLVRKIEGLHEAKKTKGVLVTLKGRSFPFSQAKEIGEALADLRAKKKLPIVCHTHQVDNSTFWLLSRGCSEIWVSAAGAVPTVGIGAELAYLKGAMDKVGIFPDMLAMGKYKSGGEALTRKAPSEASLANLKNTLRDLRSQWLDGVSKGRDETERRRQLVEDGPWTPKRAKELGLIDRVGFEDEARESLFDQAGTEKTKGVFGVPSGDKSQSPAAELVRLLSGASARQERKDHIAVVPAVGSITMASGGPFDGGGGITASSMTRILKRLREDDSVRAIVMRMDSPGGSPLASDLIWREMMLTREEKPVIVSIGGMSASGGYYIASGATTIVSSPAAIVGSIGVFGGKIVIGGALAKAGVTTYRVAASPQQGAAARATQASPMSRWDEPTRERVRQSMKRIYDLFVERVSEGRDLPKEKVYATAEGEIFLATVGKKRGLIDQLGGLNDALEVARKAAGLKANVPIVLEGASESVLEALLLGPDPAAQDIQAALRRFEEARFASISRWALGDSLEQLRPFSAALSPLFAGEEVVVALPYALTLH